MILIVEDEPLVRENVAQAFCNAGCTVLEAASAETAIMLLRSGQPIDVIFTDIQLAGALSGWDVAEEGRAAHAAMPVIYTSGNSVDRSRRVEASLFFDKPYNPAEVVEAYRRLRRGVTA